MSFRSLMTLLFAGLFAACASFASETSQITGSGESATSVSKPALDAIREKVALGYYGIYYGPSVAEPGASKQTTEWGKTGANQFFLNYLSASYRASKTLLPGITVLSTYTPVRGQDMTLLDPYLRLTDTQLIHQNGWSLYSELREFLPVTRASHNAHKFSTLGTFQWLSYDVPHSRLQIGAWAKFYWTVFGSSAVPGVNGISSSNWDYQAYFRPQMFYTLTPTLQASLFYEMTGNHAYKKSLSDWYNVSTYVQPGVMWNVYQGIILNPYLQFSTGGKVTTDTTALGAQIYATIL